MEFTGKIIKTAKDWMTGEELITFRVIGESVLDTISNIRKCEKLNIAVEEYKNKRSLNANGLLWMCLSKLAAALETDKWSIYLQMLKKYGKFTYICVKPSVVDAVRQQWRECEVVGNINIGKHKAVQMICYFGSSTYDTKEFSTLLNGVISDMKELDLDVPTSEAMKRALEEWERMQDEKYNSKN